MNACMKAVREFAPSPRAVRAARMFAVATVTGWGVDPTEVETVVGELAANAYVHAGSPFTVSLRRGDSHLEVEVADQSLRMPVVASGVPADAPRGRGLIMVGSIASEWGARLTEAGKVVWAELAMRVLRGATVASGQEGSDGP
jgi:anti-sigma regulatory factor (Ser/Thr protein kinase)